jgi:hypothetical protein
MHLFCLMARICTDKIFGNDELLWLAALNKLHDRPFEIVWLKARCSKLSDGLFEHVNFENRVALLPMIISAEPDRDRILFFQDIELFAGNF